MRDIIGLIVWAAMHCMPLRYVAPFALRARAACQWAVRRGIL